MSRLEPTSTTERVNALRARRRAAGRVILTTDLPSELIDCLDRIKEGRGVSSRAPLVEEALRLLIEKETGA
ncbi:MULTISPECIES: ribbon-helix-helix protein, CopG family [Rhizobium/Agrobacterium group]|uniref:Ribbon-helix-helix protein, CopG family n=1 Tax=Agrobacterium tumefaciens TaxID=358 RepID=A0AAE6BHX8_AGRTU|nr:MULTISPECIES: ribbon-helix-helix protein, CopG family [Agrobacterium tumefaciens complex]QCL82914.1 ribbon-helix-helix protein, CopG family [Agrobacterium tumefaciens]UXS56435.1 ribbon-helix-helix protein, CopG family [Agrobacterium tumefaciens]UXS66779.1 ribbon-helix-helix protein, CopG family [Agrobacterium tumefaciens]UXT85517.1 ribbon-helix-helix protein, CopG family [Agrobacterium tumefaciens]